MSAPPRRGFLVSIRRAFIYFIFLILGLLECAIASSASVEVGVNGDVADPSASTTADGDEGASCVDDNRQCKAWAAQGECSANPRYMRVHCRKSCRACGDEIDGRIDMGVIQKIEGSDAERTREIVRRAEEYIRNEVLVEPEYESVRFTCRNQNELCAFWSAIGECEKNPEYMKIHCAPVCRSCEKIDINNRCPRDPEKEVDAIGPGDLDALFLRLTDTSDPEVAKYKPTVLSRPSHPEGEANPDDATYKIGPWVVTFDDFTTPEECERLIHLGGVEGYERSTDVGKRKFDGTYDKTESSSRTSSNAWCQHDCYKDPLSKRVIDRIESFTGIPEKNSEHLQLLKYEEGQLYVTHHDYIPHHVERAPGPRILTFFLYLNDVEAGGGTDFPQLGLTVHPKRGRALLWPSVLSSDPNEKDGRTSHQALPVITGVKYGANAWIHLRDFKTPNENNCS